jgi:hypothetical protein
MLLNTTRRALLRLAAVAAFGLYFFPILAAYADDQSKSSTAAATATAKGPLEFAGEPQDALDAVNAAWLMTPARKPCRPTRRHRRSPQIEQARSSRHFYLADEDWMNYLADKKLIKRTRASICSAILWC